MPKKVLTITMNPALDVNSEADEVLTDQKVRCEKPKYDPGGGGINVARVLTRLGIEVDAEYLVGGVPGEFLKQLLQDEDMNDHPIEISGITRENTSIIDKKTGEQYRFVFPGPEIEEKEWKGVLEKVKKEISSYDIVVASGSLPPGVPVDFYSRIAKIVLEEDKTYILDTSGDFLVEGIRNGATFIKPNQEEFEVLIEKKEADGKDDLIQKLFSLGVENVIHTMGKEGTYLYNQSETKSFTPPEVEVNSSIGAGDSFVGGLVAGLAEEKEVGDAICYGISAAASTLKSPGTDLCDYKEVQSISKELCGKKV
ncbi:MAG: 1-phosphofructokinase family hexose kinase [Balneolaceae bacterium]|nr:1-phosphofructokinase family hexose kinase [Balneolaceae bacterium]